MPNATPLGRRKPRKRRSARGGERRSRSRRRWRRHQPLRQVRSVAATAPSRRRARRCTADAARTTEAYAGAEGLGSDAARARRMWRRPCRAIDVWPWRSLRRRDVDRHIRRQRRGRRGRPSSLRHVGRGSLRLVIDRFVCLRGCLYWRRHAGLHLLADGHVDNVRSAGQCQCPIRNAGRRRLRDSAAALHVLLRGRWRRRAQRFC